MTAAQHICVGELTAPHGVRGLLRLRTFLDDAAQIFTLPLTKANGAPVRLTARGQQKDGFLVALDGVVDRTQALQWRGVKLYAPRAALPPSTSTEFLVADLQGLQAIDQQGIVLGQVVAIYDFGAGVSLEIERTGQPKQKNLIVPFNNRTVPAVDVAAGRLTVDLPIEVEARAEAEVQA